MADYSNPASRALPGSRGGDGRAAAGTDLQFVDDDDPRLANQVGDERLLVLRIDVVEPGKGVERAAWFDASKAWQLV